MLLEKNKQTSFVVNVTGKVQLMKKNELVRLNLLHARCFLKDPEL